MTPIQKKYECHYVNKQSDLMKKVILHYLNNPPLTTQYFKWQ